MQVFLDTDEDQLIPLECVAISDQTWNGYLIPHVTVDAFKRFVAAWAQADRNGTFGEVFVDGDSICHQPNDTYDDFYMETWPLVASTPEPLYAIDGWTFVAANETGE